jgi:hypothetical protein
MNRHRRRAGFIVLNGTVTQGSFAGVKSTSEATSSVATRPGVEAGFLSNGAPGYRNYAPGYYAAFLLDPDGNTIEALYRDVGNPGHIG